jgi:ferredoxin
LKKDLKDCAASLGFALCGVTLLDRRFVARGFDDRFPYPTAVVLGMEMRKEWLMQAPNYRLRRYPDYDVYRRAGNAVHRVANFIRRQGVSCSARVAFNGAAIYPVHAITAGLGELGAFGGVITPEFGPRQRWCMITVDAELPLDGPADRGLAEFCEKCLLCVAKCPAKAIPERPMWWRGVYKRKINDLKCWAFFTGWHTCAVCINVCPLHRFGPREVLEHYERTGEALGYEEIKAEKPMYRKTRDLEALLESVR